MQQGFVAQRDVDIVRRSTKGIGTNEGNLVNTLCNRTKKQIDAVDLLYHDTVRALIKWESIDILIIRIVSFLYSSWAAHLGVNEFFVGVPFEFGSWVYPSIPKGSVEVL